MKAREGGRGAQPKSPRAECECFPRGGRLQLPAQREGRTRDMIFSLWKTFTTNCLQELCQIPLAFHKGW